MPELDDRHLAIASKVVAGFVQSRRLPQHLFEDLLSEAVLVLVPALRKFDSAKCDIEGFVAVKTRHALLDHARRAQGVPRSWFRKLSKACKPIPQTITYGLHPLFGDYSYDPAFRRLEARIDVDRLLPLATARQRASLMAWAQGQVPQYSRRAGIAEVTVHIHVADGLKRIRRGMKVICAAKRGVR